MSKDVESRRISYKWALVQGRVPLSRKRSAAEQLERFCDAQARMNDIRALVRKVACEHGVPTITMVAYYSFSLAVDKVMRQYDSATRHEQVRQLLDRWTGRGLDKVVLEAILLLVFAYELPE